MKVKIGKSYNGEMAKVNSNNRSNSNNRICDNRHTNDESITIHERQAAIIVTIVITEIISMNLMIVVSVIRVIIARGLSIVPRVHSSTDGKF